MVLLGETLGERQEKGRCATKLICTKLPQRLIESGKSVYKMLRSGFEKLYELINFLSMHSEDKNYVT